MEDIGVNNLRKYTCVDFPQPVSPATKTILFSEILCKISSRYSAIGRLACRKNTKKSMNYMR